MNPNPGASRLAALLSFTLACLLAGPAAARRNGIQAPGCTGCHAQNGGSTITLTPDRDPVEPGDVVKFAATITWPGIQVGGIYVPKPDLGTLGTSAGQGLTLAGGALTQSSPKAAVGDTVTFNFTWTAPTDPGAVVLGAFFVAGNNNDRNTGDAPGSGYVNFTWGCEPKLFYFDIDGDGHGTRDQGATDVSTMDFGTLVACADQPPPPGYSELDDDCDDLYKSVYPGAPERCNGKDDDCDGEVDEDAMPETLYPDPDGDGYYDTIPGTPIVGCLPLAGYADEPGDCAPTDPTRNPGAEEVCNLFDDDCDGLVDEDSVRPRCGEGRCARESPTCNPDDCVPGTPLAETCNGLDDDCNGEVDDGELCPPGEQCLGIHCAPLELSGATGGSGGTNGGGAASGSSENGGDGAGGNPAQGDSGKGPVGGGTAGDTTGGTAAAVGEPSRNGGAPADEPPIVVLPAKSRGCSLTQARSSAPALFAFGAGLFVLAGGTARRRRRCRSSVNPTLDPPDRARGTSYRDRAPERRPARQRAVRRSILVVDEGHDVVAVQTDGPHAGDAAPERIEPSPSSCVQAEMIAENEEQVRTIERFVAQLAPLLAKAVGRGVRCLGEHALDVPVGDRKSRLQLDERGPAARDFPAERLLHEQRQAALVGAQELSVLAGEAQDAWGALPATKHEIRDDVAPNAVGDQQRRAQTPDEDVDTPSRARQILRRKIAGRLRRLPDHDETPNGPADARFRFCHGNASAPRATAPCRSRPSASCGGSDRWPGDRPRRAWRSCSTASEKSGSRESQDRYDAQAS